MGSGNAAETRSRHVARWTPMAFFDGSSSLMASAGGPLTRDETEKQPRATLAWRRDDLHSSPGHPRCSVGVVCQGKRRQPLWRRPGQEFCRARVDSFGRFPKSMPSLAISPVPASPSAGQLKAPVRLELRCPTPYETQCRLSSRALDYLGTDRSGG